MTEAVLFTAQNRKGEHKVRALRFIPGHILNPVGANLVFALFFLSIALFSFIALFSSSVRPLFVYLPCHGTHAVKAASSYEVY